MTTHADVMCLIPARSGSKRVVDKNLQLVGGRSLLERSIEVALEAFGRVWVSTDSEAYALAARSAGANVPELRPGELATDESRTDDVVRHAVSHWAPAETTVLVVAQATSPFTVSDDLLAVVDALTTPGAATALTVTQAPPTAAYVAAARSESGLARFLLPDLVSLRTQQLPLMVVPNGAAYAAPISRLRAGGDLIVEPLAPVILPPERCVDIDTLDDLRQAQAMASLEPDRRST